MTHAKGTYLGGIRTVEDIRQRCYVDDVGGCWHWRMGWSRGLPVAFVACCGKPANKMNTRRAVVILARGKDLPKSHVATPCKESKDCVNPKHVRVVSRSTQIQERGASHQQISGLLRLAKSRRKLTQEQAMEILTSSETIQAISERMEISHHTAWAIRRGRYYRDVAGHPIITP